jgi:6-phosphofructokinase 2
MAKDGVVTLTMNPALDLSTEVDVVVPFTKLRCGAMRRDPGGGGINVARVIARLGGKARAVFPTGGCVGQLLLQLVAAEGVANVPVPIAEETREDFTVFERKTGNQFRFVEPGPKLAQGEWEALLDAFAGEAKGAAFAVISGSLPPGVPDTFFATAAERMKALGVELALDTTGAGLKAALAHGVALVKPNKREFEELLGLEAPSPAQLAAAARDLVAQKNVGAVALTLAEEGAILATRAAAWRAEAPQVKAVSTVGAGDSFLGAMIKSLIEGKDWPQAFRTGVAAGTAALLSPGTDLAHPADVNALAPKVVISQIA